MIDPDPVLGILAAIGAMTVGAVIYFAWLVLRAFVRHERKERAAFHAQLRQVQADRQAEFRREDEWRRRNGLEPFGRRDR